MSNGIDKAQPRAAAPQQRQEVEKKKETGQAAPPQPGLEKKDVLEQGNPQVRARETIEAQEGKKAPTTAQAYQNKGTTGAQGPQSVQQEEVSSEDSNLIYRTGQALKKIMPKLGSKVDMSKLSRFSNLAEEVLSQAKDGKAAGQVLEEALDLPQNKGVKQFLKDIAPGKTLDILALGTTIWKNMQKNPKDPTSGIDNNMVDASMRGLFQVVSCNLIEEAYAMRGKGLGADIGINTAAAVLGETSQHTETKVDDIAAKAFGLAAEGTPSRLADGAASLYYDMLIKGTSGDEIANRALAGKYGIAMQGSAVIADSFTKEGQQRILKMADEHIQNGTLYGDAVELSTFMAGTFDAAQKGDWGRVLQLAQEEIDKGSLIGQGIQWSEKAGIVAFDIGQDAVDNVRDLAHGDVHLIHKRAEEEIKKGTTKGKAIQGAEGVSSFYLGDQKNIDRHVKEDTVYGRGVRTFEEGIGFWAKKLGIW